MYVSKVSQEALTVLIVTHVTHVKRVKRLHYVHNIDTFNAILKGLKDYIMCTIYRLDMVNLKSFISKVLLQIKWKFELI